MSICFKRYKGTATSVKKARKKGATWVIYIFLSSIMHHTGVIYIRSLKKLGGPW